MIFTRRPPTDAETKEAELFDKLAQIRHQILQAKRYDDELCRCKQYPTTMDYDYLWTRLIEIDSILEGR